MADGVTVAQSCTVLEPAVRLREGRPGDLDALLRLEQASFVFDRATRRALRHAMRSPTMSLVVAVAESERGQAAPETLVGAATLEWRRGSTIARIGSISVAPTWRGRGFGGRLLAAIEAEAADQGRNHLRLEARADNGAAIRLYARHAYVRYAIKRAYYEDGATAWAFEKSLAGR